jgi:hypothetical protein
MQQLIGQERNQENNPIHSSLREKKCLGIDLSKEVKDLYNLKCKTLKKEIEEGIRKWKDLHVHRLVELIL